MFWKLVFKICLIFQASSVFESSFRQDFVGVDFSCSDLFILLVFELMLSSWIYFPFERNILVLILPLFLLSNQRF